VTALRIERADAGQFRIAGRLGFPEATAALGRSSELFDGNARDVAVDVAGLEGVDSATLAVLLAWSARAQSRGIALRFTGVPAGLRALAHLCDAEPLLGIA
jgi:phospholipid transport system transporter-binding protein